jgi:hypothetical protein
VLTTFFFVVLQMEPRALCMLSKVSVSESHPNPACWLLDTGLGKVWGYASVTQNLGGSGGRITSLGYIEDFVSKHPPSKKNKWTK